MTSPATESPWATSVVLSDGESAFIRPLTPADQHELAAFHERQSPQSIYRRYFSPRPRLSEKELEHFTNVDMVDRAALAVEVHDRFIAWASYERWPGRNEAEAAFMVDDEHQGRGIATLLLEHLAAIARSNGIERFTAEVLGDNRAMLAVFAKAGWPLERRFDSGVVDLDWELATTDEFLDSVERREQRADSRAVARMLLPRAIAVIGASGRPGSVGNALWRHVRDSVTVPVYPVNPKLTEIDGERCFASVLDLPDEVSLGIVAVPAAALVETIDACIAKRMRGAVIVTSLDIEPPPDIDLDALVTRSRRNGLRLIGPSSMGVAGLHPGTELQAALVDVDLPPDGVAISMQSGTLGGSLLRRAAELHLGVSWFVSLGDKCDVSANDLLQFWVDDDTTRVIALYTESFGNPRKFARIARRVSQTKPVVAVRTGAAADGNLGSALYQQAGLIEVPTVAALLDTSRVLGSQPVLRGPRVAVVTNSKSPGTLADAALRGAGLEPLPGPTRLDWRATPDDYDRAIRTALADEEVDGLLVIHAPPLAEYVAETGDAIHRAALGATKPVVAVLIGSGDGPVVAGSPVPGFAFPEPAAAALGRSYGYHLWRTTEGATATTPTRAVDPTRAAELIVAALAERPDPAGDGSTDDPAPCEVDLETAADLLAAYGVDVAPTRCASPDSAVAAADELGYPVAVKSRHRHPGRSARAGVALDLGDAGDVADAVSTIVESLGDDADRLVVQRMSEPGLDVRIRCERDPRTGVIVTVGFGGANADAIGDRASRLAPVSHASAAAMLTETRVGAAINEAGFDRSSLVATIVQTAQLCADHAEVDTIDLNPVIVSADATTVTDLDIRLVDRPDVDGPLRKLG